MGLICYCTDINSAPVLLSLEQRFYILTVRGDGEEGDRKGKNRSEAVFPSEATSKPTARMCRIT